MNGDPYHGGNAAGIRLLVDLGDDARADRTATLADREAQALVHRVSPHKATVYAASVRNR